MIPIVAYKKKVLGSIAAVGFLLFLLCHSSLAQTAGQVMFVGYNGDNTDGLAFVTFVDLPNGTTIYFNDNEWNGLAIGSGGAFNNNTEGALTWANNTGSAIVAGTVIIVQSANNNPTVNIGTVTESDAGFDLDVTNEVIYMFLGSGNYTPTVFLSAIANDGFGNGPLTNTGLTSGTTATSITGDEDMMAYTGSTNCNSTIAACATAIATASNWTTQDGGGNQYNDGTFPDFPGDVPCDFFGTAMYPAVTYYSAASGNWDDENTWTLLSDGSGAPAGTGVWPRRTDNVVILSGHTVTIDADDDNKHCGVSPDDLNPTNVGPFTGSGTTMFYHTGSIIIEGTLNSDVATMIEGYTLVEDGGTFYVNASIVNLGVLEVSSSASFDNNDDLILSGNSSTIINNTTTGNDDIFIDWPNATLCGTGAANIGDDLQFSNGATTAQVCSSFTFNCGGTCGTPTGTFISGYTGPGGVGDAITNQLWLRADDLTLNDGDPVTTWSDVSGNGLSAIQGTAADQPTFQANDVNSVLPSISFDGGDYLNLGNTVLDFIPGTDEFSFFITFNVPNGNEGTFFSKAQSNGAGRQYQYTTDGANFFTSFMGGNYNQGSVTVADAWTVGSATTTSTDFDNYVNGTNDVGGGGVGTATLPGIDVLIGARRNLTNADTGFRIAGRISEIAMYNAEVNLAQRIVVENYLSAKYNTTLSANDVYDMDNSGNGDYDFEVAGIGQASDGSNHRDARGSGLVRIWNPSGLGNSEFLIWGHDNGAIAGTTTDVDGALIEERLERVWRVAETGDVGTVSISIDLALPIGNPFGSELSLLIDRDGDGFSDNDVTPVAGAFSATGDQVIFSGINFQDGDRFTLGNSNLVFPLPIELLFFRAEVEGSMVNLFWSTASETNNDFFTVERSKTAVDWETVVNVPGAGTSNTQLNYTTIDDGSYQGTSYYRLKQTDFDGNYSYSKIERVVIEFEDQIIVHPNPTRGSFIISAPFNLSASQVEMIDNLGRTVPLSMSVKDSGTTAEVDSNLLAPGIYILRVTDSFVVKSVRVVIYR